MQLKHLALPLLALCLGCPSEGDDDAPSDGGPSDAMAVQDKCSTEAPCSLMPGMRDSDLVAPEMDVDAWTFNVDSAGKVINVLVENDATVSPIRLEMVLFDPDQQSLGTERFSGNGRQRIEIQLVAPKAGEYRVVVRDVGNDAQDRLNPYFITVTLLDETDNNEPNDGPMEATPLTRGTPASGTIGFEGDADWFSIDIPANNLIQVSMSVTGDSPVELEWALFESTGNTQIAISSEPSDGSPWPVENRAVGNAAGTYLIRVADAGNDNADLSRVYVLTVDYVQEPDQYDLAAPNETYQTATAITAGTTVEGYIASTSDVDWYSIQITNAPQLILVRGTLQASEVDLAFEVFEADGETHICDMRDADLCKALRLTRDGTLGAASLETAHVAMTNGTYYVLVKDFQDNDFDLAARYSVLIDTPPEPDARENYNLAGDRTTAFVVPTVTGTAGATIQFAEVNGYISHANDTDWFRLDIPGPGGAVGQNGDWEIEFHLENDGPTPVELEAFFFGDGRSYAGYGQRCRDPDPNGGPDQQLCQYPEADNAINVTSGSSTNECFVVFREVTANGPHYFRISDLDRDDFDLRGNGGQYRFTVTVNAGCAVPGVCEGIYLQGGNDLCGRP